MTEKSLDHELNEDIYDVGPTPKLKLLSLLIGLFLIAFFTHLQLQKTLESKVTGTLAKALGPQCPLQASDIQMHLPLPKVTLGKVVVPAQCIKHTSPLNLKDISVTFLGPAFSPLGVKVHTTVPLGKGEKIGLTSILSSQKVILKMDDENLSFKALSSFFPNLKWFQGKLLVNTLFELSKNKVSKGDFRLESQDLKVSAINYQGIEIPQMNLKTLLAQGNLSQKKGSFLLSLDQKDSEDSQMGLILGDQNAPIQLQLKGNIVMNPANPRLSSLNLRGKVKLEQALLDSFPFVTPILDSNFKKQGDFYEGRIQGTLAAPLFSH